MGFEYRRITTGSDREGNVYTPAAREKYNRISEDVTGVPVQKDERNLVDLAVAAPKEELAEKNFRLFPWIYSEDECQVIEPMDVVQRMECVKIGARTGVTKGRVLKDSYTMSIGDHIFQDQILSSNIAKPGDSGSMLLDKDHNPVGQVFARDSRGRCVSNKITNIVTEMENHFGVDVEVIGPRPDVELKDLEKELERIEKGMKQSPADRVTKSNKKD